jgi:hypothetical protein
MNSRVGWYSVLVKQKVDLLLVREDPNGKAPVYAFRSAGMDIEQTQAVNLQEALASLQKSDPNGAI